MAKARAEAARRLHAALLAAYGGVPGQVLRQEFFLGSAVETARALLGKVLVTCFEFDGRCCTTAGIITETEAYEGAEDRACHAYGNRRTARTEVMFGPCGVSYIYRCHMYELLNVVVREEGRPHAVLVRALQPLEGVAAMLRRRGKGALDDRVAAGPGMLAAALGLSVKHNARPVTRPGEGSLWIEDRGISVPPSAVVVGPRVGIDYAGPDKHLPYRFIVPDSAWAPLLGGAPAAAPCAPLALPDTPEAPPAAAAEEGTAARRPRAGREAAEAAEGTADGGGAVAGAPAPSNRKRRRR